MLPAIPFRPVWPALFALVACTTPDQPGEASITLSRTALESVELPEAPQTDVGGLQVLKLERAPDGTYRGELPFPSLIHRRPHRPPGFDLVVPGASVTYDPNGAARTWSVYDRELTVRLPERTEPQIEVRVRHRASTKDEVSRDPTTRQSDDAFVSRTVSVGTAELHGAFLPTPGRATWKVVLPARARFESQARMLEPEVLPREKQGFVVASVEVEVDGEVVASSSCAATPEKLCPLELDLTAYQGREARVTLRGLPLHEPTLNDVFFEDPVIYSPLAEPKRVVIVFVDTLRRDRLGTYGATRTTANIDAFAAGAAVFDRARTLASWTLPSVRAAHTGRQPEDWEEARTLAERLAEAGWATTGITNNAFLSPPMTMGRGYGRYDYDFLAPAPDQVGRAIAALERHPDRNQLVMVQFMDTHLPYGEPEPFRSMYAPGDPLGPGYLLGHVARLEDPTLRRYTADRYDQAVQFVDHSLAPLFAALRPDDLVVLHSDHGDEFWEHGGVEHGHAIWEEVVRVPLMIRAPGLEARRIDAPVSLMDLTPTLLELLGLPPVEGAVGESMVPLLHGEEPPAHRPQVIGRTLHGADAWGVVDGSRKWIASRGWFRMFDLEADPGEQHPIELSEADRALGLSLMSKALGREVLPVISLRGPGKHLGWRGVQVTIELDVPAHATWVGARVPDRPPNLDGNKVIYGGPQLLPGETYVLPVGGVSAVNAVVLSMKIGQRVYTQRWERGSSEVLQLEVGPPNQRLTLQIDHVPLPARIEVPTTHEDLEDQLEALGYAD